MKRVYQFIMESFNINFQKNLLNHNEEKYNLLKTKKPTKFIVYLIKIFTLKFIDLEAIHKKKLDFFITKIDYINKVIEKQYLIINVLEELKNILNMYYINNNKNKKYLKILDDIQQDETNEFNLFLENNLYQSIIDYYSDNANYVKFKNLQFIEKEKKEYKHFFDTIEDNPLTNSQREAVIINEDSNLVIAGAGSGKTSVIVAKVGYLIKKKYAKPSEILVLAFNTKAVEEIKERINSKLNLSTNISTFHSFGLNVLSNNDKKQMICNWATDNRELTKLIRQIIEDKLTNLSFFEIFKEYFIEHFYHYKNEFDFQNKGEYYNYIKNYELITLKGELVKSYEELVIANFLSLKNIKYLYEHPYEYETATSKYRQYQPDFYLPEYNIYIEHYGIAKDGSTAPYINKEDYLNSMVWKRSVHRNYKTICIETYSYEKMEGNLISLLEKKLSKYNVKFEDLSFEEVLEIFNQENGTIDSFTKLTIQFLNHFKNNRYTVDIIKNKLDVKNQREKAFLEIFSIIYYEYETKKSKSNCIDFYDMINNAVNIIRSGIYNPKYKYILIDEFQDISSSRNDLIKSLCDVINDVILTTVGDDWQSINRFAGSNVSIIKNFTEYYTKSETIFLNDTFRFDNNISKVATQFIIKNPTQIKKSINTYKNVETPSIYIYREYRENDSLERILNFLGKKVEGKKEVLILGRFNHLKPNNFEKLQNKYSNTFNLKFMTIHGSKGLGAEYVILLGLERGKFGFPCEIEDDPLLQIVMSQKEDFIFAEERRLFYVALTRTKEKLFILTDKFSPSEFIDEIIKDNSEKEIQYLNERDYIAKHCPECELGILKQLENDKGDSYYGCSNYPLCDYTESIKKCTKCGNLLHKDIESHLAICGNVHCGNTEKLCLKCNSYMALRKKDDREFLGCSNFYKTGCNYTISC